MRFLARLVFAATFVLTAQDTSNDLEREKQEYLQALERDPRNIAVVKTITGIVLKQAQLPADKFGVQRKSDELRGWGLKLLELAPNESLGHYAVGFAGYTKCLAPVTAAHFKLGGSQWKPLSDPKLRIQLRAQCGTIIDEAVDHLRRAIDLDSKNADAMGILTLTLLQRALLRDLAEESERDRREFEYWSAKRRSMYEASQPRIVAPRERIRVDAGAQAYKRYKWVDPVYPRTALERRIQGAVRFAAIIGKDGSVDNLQLISGHPLLLRAAAKAVRQWRYRPSFVRDQPVEVVTTIDVWFELP